MRLDAYLSAARLIKRRTLAKQACDRGLIKVNGTIAKGSRTVAPGHIIELELPRAKITVEVAELPLGNVRAADAAMLYRTIE